ncbi:Phospholipase D alpha 4 [Zea mays]|uniref:Phospholipase D n=1 Tax=Zea mays TaxID=4577 RepID=A0A3L6DAW1_MAIZE|nr:Phospholipase D alpha 4 [Zea mays]
MARPQTTTTQLLLHGVIEARILAADLSGHLQPTKKALVMKKMFSWIRKVAFCRCQRQLENAVGLGTDGKLYATVDIDKARVGRTRMVPPVNSPKWDESFRIYCAHDASDIIFTVKADNAIGATLIGRAYLPTDSVVAGNKVNLWLPIRDEKRQPLEGGDQIHVQLQFTDVAADPTAGWGAGVGSAAYDGVPHTFFKQRRGCRVRLYEDAHVAADFSPRIRLAGGRFYEPRRCWVDVFDAINRARRMVYIAGWSVNTDVVLVRDPRKQAAAASENLGELLIRKANEGVTVLMLVWDDRTSVGLGPIRRDGLMATGDQDTAAFFRGTRVQCVLCPRNPDKDRSYVQDIETDTMFTHHQKTVIVDGGGRPAPWSPPGLVGFLGGIDMCDGRYDTQDHPLFRTLGTTHNRDFHQPNFPGACSGPSTAARRRGSPRPEPSADAPREAAALGLVTGKDHVMERSIQDAYIHAIRRARDFVYIENQYFLGSSYAWRQNDGVSVEDINALHLIPRELSLKIVSKIEAGERFAVYVVVPLWPEGVPESGSVQAILDWQRRTMEMMYKDVLMAIRAKGLQADPRDYLTFFCLGNREAPCPGEYVPPEHPDPNTDYERAQRARRFMIYVHAKTMIVDDEYIIVGSANINQRSMDGGRDTEIAIGAYQPGYLAIRNTWGRRRRRHWAARGQVHGFRVSLWKEHLGQAAAAALGGDLLRPSSLTCVRRMNQVAKQHWDMFASDAFQGNLPGHLMAYPVSVLDDGGGKIVATTETFPDTNAKVLGIKSDILPPILTT